MANKIPRDVARLVKKESFKKLDEHNYLQKSRVENNKLIGILVTDPQIGGILENFMSREDVRTYVKDVLLHNYSLEINSKLIPLGRIISSLKEFEKTNISLIEGDKRSKAFLFSTDNGELIVVGKGTVAKWETALRKSLEVIARMPDARCDKSAIKKYLFISIAGNPLVHSDRTLIKKAVGSIGVSVVFCD